MKPARLILALSSLLCIEAQAQNRRTQNTKINQDQIYFADNIPAFQQAPTSNVEIQKSVEPVLPIRPSDSYAQAVFPADTNQSYNPFNNTVSQNSNVAPLSTNLQPPTYDKNDQNYYSAYNERYDVTSRNDVVPTTEVSSAAHMVPEFNNVSLAVTNFGLRMLQNMDQRSGNLVFSPFSVAQLLALLHQGAGGLSQQQMTEALHMTPETSAQAFYTINSKLKRRNSHNILKVANNLYIADAFELNPAFKLVATRAFDCGVTPANFFRPQGVVQMINGWIAQKTNNKITQLLAEDAISENTQLVMVNAVYFKGLWAVRFKPESTVPRDFFTNAITKKTAPFMRIRKIFRAGIDSANHAQVVILPFENEEYSLMLILPSQASTLEALVPTLTKEQLVSYHGFTPKEVDLEIPKFTVKADTNLDPLLKKMGVSKVFTQQSELSGIGVYRTLTPQISSALHSALLSIDEDGGSAAAATSFAVVALSYDDPSLIIKVNRPFLALIWDNENAMPLFMARIQDPTS